MIKCPACGKFEFEEEDDFVICKICKWENDGLQKDDPDFPAGANYMSLNQYRALLTKLGAERFHAMHKDIRKSGMYKKLEELLGDDYEKLTPYEHGVKKLHFDE